MTAATLPSGQAALLREAADTDGLLYLGAWATPADVKAVKALIRQGMLTPSDVRGAGYHQVTDHGRNWLEANTQEATR